MTEKLLQSIPADQPAESSAPVPPPALPVHSSLDNRLLGWTTPESAQKLMATGRGVLVRDKSGRARRINLKVQPGDENDPQVWDLMNRMAEGRKTVYREIVNASQHIWVWSHKLRGENLEAYREVGRAGLIKDGVLPKPGRGK